MTTSTWNLAYPLHRHALRTPEALALYVAGQEYSYATLDGLSARIAGWLRPEGAPAAARVGILASRSLEAYAGILGAAWAGAAYVPLSPKLPEERLVGLLQRVALDALIADADAAAHLSPRALAAAPPRRLSLQPNPPAAAGFTGTTELEQVAPCPTPATVAAEDLAYIMFTSGTTGAPKGVTIPVGAVAHFLAGFREFLPLGAHDRLSQACEITFDPSVLDMFAAWGAGASLHVVPAGQLLAPREFIRERQLTYWNSVPSIPAFLRRLRMLTPNAFPSLRYSIFSGEPLTLDLARAWAAAAPHSMIENQYGPTEATVNCLRQRLSPSTPVTANRGIMAIGTAFPGLDAAIWDPDSNPVPAGQAGELVIAGPQLAQGYWRDPAETARRFPEIAGRRWYRTGDLAYADGTATYFYLGRIDNQVKLLGQRIELEEIDARLRSICSTDQAATIAWPIEDEIATGLAAFVAGTSLAPAAIRTALLEVLPAYMVPARIRILAELPLTANGKIDRRALAQTLAKISAKSSAESSTAGTATGA